MLLRGSVFLGLVRLRDGTEWWGGGELFVSGGGGLGLEPGLGLEGERGVLRCLGSCGFGCAACSLRVGQGIRRM